MTVVRDPETTMRECKECGMGKPVSEFQKHKRREGGYTYGYKCKVCLSRNGVLWRYRLTATQYFRMMEAQGGRCAICRRTPEQAGNRPLAVDHDHECCADVDGRTVKRTCGKCNRGLLCMRCNVFLGYLDDHDYHMSALIYLEKDRSRSSSDQA